jgi:hypothetical protein
MAKKPVIKKTTKSLKKTVKKIVKKTVKDKKRSATKIIVTYDCGFHNHLTIRGEGAGLSWHHGTALKNTDKDQWIFEIVCPDLSFEFKILINDQVFEIGENHQIKKGEMKHILPRFH